MRHSPVQNLLSLKSSVLPSTRRLTAVVLLLAISSYVALMIVQADTTPQTLPFSQNWSNVGLITADNNWSAVPGIIGYRGDDLTTATGTNPQTILADGSSTPVNVEANETAPNTFATGGVAEFHITDPTIALNGSGTADAPHIVITLNTTGQTNVNVAYNLRDLDGSTDNAIMPVALQYRVGTSGNYTDAPAGFVADATTGPSLATLVTPVSVTLPAAVNNQSVVQVRIITANAVGNDEWVGIDDINITGTPIDPTPALSINDVSITEGNGGVVTANFTVSLSAPAPMGGVTFDITTQDNTATIANNDYVAKSLTAQTIPAGQMSYTFSVTVNSDTNVEPNETFFVNVSNVTGANVADGQGVGTIVNDDFSITLIHDIQGAAETPNFLGQIVAIRGVVVGDFQGSSNLNGFFVQEEDADADADPATSEGVFVFDPATLTNVNVGDNVTVTGTVINFGSPLGLTELTNLVGVVVNSGGNSLPAAAIVSLPVANSPAADLERFEGMRVTFNQTLFVTDNVDLGGFGELSLSGASPLFIPTNSVDPNDNPASGNSTSGNSNVAAVTAQQTLNDNSRIVLNDGKTGSNPNPIPFIGAGTNATVRRGDTVANLSGILSFGFGSYRIEPATLPLSFTASNPRPMAPAPVGGSLRVASFNIENFFVTANTDPNYRGPNNPTEFMRKRDKVVAALAGLNADVIGLIELEKATTNGNAATVLAAALTTAMGGGANTYAAIADPATLVGTDPDIKSGIIYRASAVAPVGGVMTDTGASAGTYSRDPISQTFQQNSTGEKFIITVNHFRSKSCSGASGADADQGDGQACFNARRRSQAQALLAFINNTLIPIDPDALIVGDLNSYAQEDPIDVLRAAGQADILNQFVSAPSQYSFTFNGEMGRLDHAFATVSLASRVTGATLWHINADEPDVFDYNTENKPDDRYAATPFRSADHDPILIGLDLFIPIAISGQKFNDLDGDGVKEAGESGVQGVTIQLDAGANGIVEATTTTDANGNFSFTNLGPGTYRIREAAPAGSAQTTANPADIVAQSGVNVSGVDFGNFRLISISGQKFSDLDADGVKDAGEPGVQGVTINLDQGANGSVDATTTTDINGNYNFTNLGPGAYRIREVAPAGSTQTTANPADIITTSGLNVAGVNFGNFTPPALVIASAIVADPSVCLGPGGVVGVRATVTNNSANAQPLTLNAMLDPALLALPGTCSANTGSCMVPNASTVTWTGALNPGQTVTINYQAQIADGTPAGTEVCANSVVTVGAMTVGGVRACATVNCQATGPGAPPPATSPVSDQRAGSVLIYNIHTSIAASPNTQDARINITNTEPSRSVIVKLFFVDGSNCSVADSFICLTPNQTASFLTSDLDPGTTGYIVVVAIDGRGCPINFNYLIGDEYVKFASGHAANLGAEAITAIAGGLPPCDGNSQSAVLSFDGVSYSPLSRVLALDNIASLGDGNNTTLILNSIGGDLRSNVSALGSISGVFYNDAEVGVSFSFSPGSCQFRSSVTNNFPRITPRFGAFVPAGRSGWLKLNSNNDQAILGVAINFNPNAASAAGAFNQGRNLHKLTLTTSASFTIPVFPPNC